MVVKRIGVIARMFSLVIPGGASAKGIPFGENLERGGEGDRRNRTHTRNDKRVWLMKWPLATSIFFLLPVFSLLDAQVPTITSFTPLTAAVGSTVTINGTEF